jgi:hypothetical protein
VRRTAAHASSLGAAALARAATLAAFVLLLAMPSSSEALALSPHWMIISTAAPTYFNAGDEDDYYEVIAVNDGGAPTDGSTITVSDSLPAGVEATAVSGEAGVSGHGFITSPLVCLAASSCETEAGTVVAQGEVVRVKVALRVQPGATGELVNDVTISGGGAATAAASSSTPIPDEPLAVPFGATISSALTRPDGTTARQAGSHDFNFTTMIALNVSSVDADHECHESPGCPLLNAEAKDIRLELPPGMTGNPQVVPRCHQPAFQSFGDHNCPPETQVGYAQLFFYGSGTATQYAPVYDLEAPPGVPGELGFTAAGQNHIPIFFHLRSDGDYGLTTSLTGISEADPVHVAALTLWGVPADPSHDSQRQGPESSGCEEGCGSEVLARPFLRIPTSCPGGPLEVGLESDSWQEPGEGPLLPSATLPGTNGCDSLSFKPSLEIQPDTLRAGAPVGYTAQLQTPQSEDPAGLSSPDMRAAVVTLPSGTTLSPSAANGLKACPLDQFALDTEVPAHCPAASIIGTATATTPLLEKPLTGRIFLGESECAPCGPREVQDGRLMPLLIEAEGSGVVIKLLGDASVDQVSETVRLAIKESPRLPISDLKLSLKAGEDALLANPQACGATFANALITPWSSLAPVATASPQVTIGGCPPLGFTPSMQAGTTETARAGAYGGFAITINRRDRDQELGSFTLSPPPGMLGKLSSVPQCAEALANAGTCPTTSQIGGASLVAGPGRQPYELTGGRVFLTGPYAGKPFGLSIVVPAEAGPLKLGGTTGTGTIVIRASIAVDEHTAALTIASSQLPLEIDGVPLDLTRIVLNIDRQGFMFNPTSCAPMATQGAVTSLAGASTPVSLPFQAVDCSKLAFTPKLTGITPAKTSIAGGTSLHVKLLFGGGDANVGKLKIALPSQLPTRLTTLQKACRAAVFDANPASCPFGSVVGVGYAQTVVLKSTMAGPAYLVSHGGAAFPDLEVVLQGEGVTLLLDGHTNISKGISSANFSELPDTPVNVFDLVLPQGPGSLLAANLPRSAHRSMCRQKLAAPVQITSQSGIVLNQRIKIAVAGCHRAKTAGHARRASRRMRNGKAHKRRS